VRLNSGARVVGTTAAVLILLAGALGNGRTGGQGGDLVAQGARHSLLHALHKLLGPSSSVLKFKTQFITRKNKIK